MNKILFPNNLAEKLSVYETKQKIKDNSYTYQEKLF